MPDDAQDGGARAGADKWIAVKPNGPDNKGEPVLIGEGGEVKGGLGGKFTGKLISEVRGEKGRPNSRTSAHAAFGQPPAPAIAEGHERTLDRHKIEKETKRAYGIKRTHANGDDEDEYTWLPKSQTSAHEGHIVGMPGWLARNHKIATETQAKPGAEITSTQATSLPIKAGHVRLAEPRKVLKETDKGIGIENRTYTRALEKKKAGKPTSTAEEAALREHSDVRWIPKSNASVENGHLIGMEPWVAEKHNFPLTEEGNAAQAATKTARIYLRVPFEKKDAVKAAGAKWDADRKSWFWPGGEMPEKLRGFAPGATGSQQVTRRTMPTRGRINEDDPSVWGSELLGWEGEPWSAFLASPQGARLQAKIEGKTPPPWAERGHDEPGQPRIPPTDDLTRNDSAGVAENYDLDPEDDGSDDPANYECGIRQDAAHDELDIARAILDGKFSSPQRYQNIWLYAIRITGTGGAYRNGIKEYVWRDPSIYLNDDFLARCNGLPVIMEHPKRTLLNSDEFTNRTIGTILLPYIEGENVMGIAKIYDESAAKMMADEQLSTSPGVLFSDEDMAKDREKLPDGSALFFEGKPILLDHVAIVPRGVWDTDGPDGVQTTLTTNGDAAVATENKEGAAAADAGRKDGDAMPDHGAKLDEILKGIGGLATAHKEHAARLDAHGARLDALCGRMDAMETAVKPSDKAPRDDGAARKDDPADAATPEGVAEGAAKGVVEAEKGKMVQDELKRRIDALEAAKPREISDEERDGISAEQAEGDRVHGAFGDAAPRPLAGEDLNAYRLRLAKGLQKHSARWKAVDLSKMPAEALPQIAGQIRADAMAVANSPLAVPGGTLREVRKTDPMTGRTISEFIGDPRVWMQQFSMRPQLVTRITNGSH